MHALAIEMDLGWDGRGETEAEGFADDESR
jgi:hypothetical protein